MTDDLRDLIEQLQRSKRWRMLAILAFSALILIFLVQTILVVTVRGDLSNTQEAVRLAQEAARSAQETATGARDTAVSAQNVAAGARDTALSAQDLVAGARVAARSAQDVAIDARDAARSAQEAVTGASDIAVSAQNLASAAFPKINDQRVYLSYRSDKAAPTEKPNEMQWDYETIYVVPVDRPPEPGTTFGETALQISPIGECRHPAWTRAGDKLAYCSFSRSGLGRGALNQIAFYHVHTGKTSFLPTRVSSMGGVSWDEKGETIAYANWGPSQVCSYNLKDAKETVHCNVEGRPGSISDVSLSPNGKWICFARERRELNLLEVSTSELTKVGKMDDKSGAVYGPFCWSRDSSYIVFGGFQLDQDGRRAPALFKYTLLEEPMTDYRANFEDIYIQQYRFWIKPEWVEGMFPKR